MWTSCDGVREYDMSVPFAVHSYEAVSGESPYTRGPYGSTDLITAAG